MHFLLHHRGLSGLHPGPATALPRESVFCEKRRKMLPQAFSLRDATRSGSTPVVGNGTVAADGDWRFCSCLSLFGRQRSGLSILNSDRDRCRGRFFRMVVLRGRHHEQRLCVYCSGDALFQHDGDCAEKHSRGISSRSDKLYTVSDRRACVAPFCAACASGTWSEARWRSA